MGNVSLQVKSRFPTHSQVTLRSKARTPRFCQVTKGLYDFFFLPFAVQERIEAGNAPKTTVESEDKKEESHGEEKIDGMRLMDFQPKR